MITVSRSVRRLINWWDFQFEKISVLAKTSRGTPFVKRVPIGMPHLPSEILDCVFYLYRTRADAESGAPFGGTGFFVGVPSDDQRQGDFIYAVTNWHVAVRDGNSVIRMNKPDGGVEIFEYDPYDWGFKPRWHDLAIMLVSINDKDVDFAALSNKLIVSDSDALSLSLGPGEDVFMVGRFADHDGATANVPAVRFGNISTMPQAIKQPTGANALGSYILDMHSRTGYSGSPIFVYRTFGSELNLNDVYVNRTMRFIKVLGLLWGNFPEEWTLHPGVDPVVQGPKLSHNAAFVKGISGMCLAVPGSAILDMLDMPEFTRARADATKKFQRLNGSDLSPTALSANSANEPPMENASHKEDFTSLLNAAAKTKPQDD